MQQTGAAPRAPATSHYPAHDVPKPKSRDQNRSERIRLYARSNSLEEYSTVFEVPTPFEKYTFLGCI